MKAGGTPQPGRAASLGSRRPPRRPPRRSTRFRWPSGRSTSRCSAGTLQHLDFAKIAKSVGIDAIEYVNQFFKDKANDAAYLAEMNTRAKGEGVTQVLIMCDGEGNLGDPGRGQAPAGGREPLQVGDAAKSLGCHSIRVNGYSTGDARRTDQARRRRPAQARASLPTTHGLNVIIENHGGLAATRKWLVQTIKHGRPQARRHAARLRQLPHLAARAATTRTRKSRATTRTSASPR